MNDNTTIQSIWEEWDQDSNYDMVTIYIYEDNVIKFRYQVEETKIDGYILKWYISVYLWQIKMKRGVDKNG